VLWGCYAGQEKFAKIIRTYYRGALGAVCVFSATEADGLRPVIEFWLREIADNVTPRCCIALVASKCDLDIRADMRLAKVPRHSNARLEMRQ
jgi:GTPase SAR1 family protein